MTAQWHREADSVGIVWLRLDIVDSSTNVLSAGVFEELDEILTELASAPPTGVVFGSGKANGFIAGADVREFQTVRGRDDALVIVKRGQRIMDRIEALPCPTVAMIHGFCLGGGLELALACDYRVALGDSSSRLGLPEIRLGIHPGFGGTVRSVRLLGPLAAMNLMLTGKTVNARKAAKIGLVDYAVPERHLTKAARFLLEARPLPRGARPVARLLDIRPVRAVLAHSMRRRVAAKAKPEHYPAPYALVDLWRRYAGNKSVMLEREAGSVASLSVTETARNLVRVFMLQNRLKALGDKRAFRPRHVHVIGAGTMGGDIAAWIALQGLSVSVEDKNTNSVTAMMRRAAALYAKRLGSERQVTSIMDRLIPDDKGAGLRWADVVIEAIFENLEAKQALFREIEPRVKSDALLATNTSCLSLERVAAGLGDPGRLVGLHFFNPVAEMPLVEVIRSQCCHEKMIMKALAFTRHIDKLPLPVRSSPGFLVNRVLTPYLLAAAIMVEGGIPVSIIDRAARDFGMAMGPLELADTVGLDIALSVGENLAREYDFEVPERLRDMVASGRLGRKTGRGFYRYKNGKLVRDGKARYTGDHLMLQNRLISKLLGEAAACLHEGVVEDADLVDAGMIFGAGFAPHLGGVLVSRWTGQRPAAPDSRSP